MVDDNNFALRRGIRDLVALTSLPAVWAGSESHDIAKSLSDVLLGTLHLDLVYIVVKQPTGEKTLELVRTNEHLLVGEEARHIGKVIAPALRKARSNTFTSIPDPFGSGVLKITAIPISYKQIAGFVVAGTRSAETLSEIDLMLLGVAANEVVTALQQAQLLADLRATNELKDRLLAKEQAARAAAQRNAERLMVLQELTSSLSQSLTIEQIARDTLQTGMRLFGSNYGSIYTVSENRQALDMLDFLNLTAETRTELGHVLISLSTPITDAVRSKEIVCIAHREEFVRRYPHLEQTMRAAGIQAMAAVPLVLKDRALGVLELSFKSPRLMKADEIQLLLSVAQQCAQALERVRLSEQARITAAVEERHRLARDLHDAVSQVLFSATTIAEVVPRIWERNPKRAMEQLEQVVLLNHAAMGEMRTLLLELRPETIVNSALSKLLMHLVEAARGRKKITGLFENEGLEVVLPPEVHIAFYRIAQEGINNILKHSEASEFRIHLNSQSDQTALQIRDNGRGFDIQQPSSGMGLGSMRERAEIVNAQFHMTSAVGKGTEVSVLWQHAEASPAAAS